MFSKAIENFQSIPAPVSKANKVYVANLERLVKFQMVALRYYVDMAITQLKAAAEVKGPEDVQNFLNGELNAFGKLRQRVMDDAKNLADLNVGFKNEFQDLVRGSVAEVTPKMAQPA